MAGERGGRCRRRARAPGCGRRCAASSSTSSWRRRRARRWRSAGPPAPASRACCGRWPGCCAARPAGSRSASEVWLDAERGIDLAPERRRCGFVFQDYALFPRMSAWRNVAYGMRRPAARAARRRRRRCSGASASPHLAEARPGALSGGERQRVALARALAARPGGAAARRAALGARRGDPARRDRASCAAVLAELEVPTVLVTHSFDEAALLAGDDRDPRPRRRRPARRRGGDLGQPRLPLRRRLRRRRGAARRGERRARRPHRGPARGRRRAAQRRPGPRPGRGQRLPLGDLAGAARRPPRRLDAQPPRRRGDLADHGRQPHPGRHRRCPSR